MGSGFDAFVKSEIYKAVHGKAEGQFEFATIFEDQVEPHNRDIVLPRAQDLFDQYVKCGAYGRLLGEIVQSPHPPQMEFSVKGEIEGVPLTGKPDLRFITKDGIHIIADWKVKGSMSKTGASPTQGYQLCLDYGSKTHGKAHKKYEPTQWKGMEINGKYLEEFEPDWSDQLAIYSWLLGEPVGGEEFVIRMEEIACRPVKGQPLPRAKCVTHMARIGKAHQESLLARIKTCWSTIQDGHIFTDLSREESDEMCEMLDGKANTPFGLHPALDRNCNESTRFKVKA